jgi:hypothetical protein
VSDTELLHKSKPEPSEPVRRLEVFTGAGRRRHWTAEQKAQILAESYEGGVAVSTVARRHGLPPKIVRLAAQGTDSRRWGRYEERGICSGTGGAIPAE